MGCYGTPGVQTPNLDELAREGIAFDCHYDTTAICMASRVNIMTGLYEYRHGCNFDTGNLLREHWDRSYPRLLAAAGYQTAFAGKFGFTVCEEPGAKGILPEEDFDRWGGGPGQTSYQTSKNKSMRGYAAQYPHSTLSYGAFATDFIQDASQSDAPFCLSISFKAPHHPVEPDPQFDEVYAGAKFVKPSNYGRENGEHFSLQSRQGRQFERFHSWKYSNDYNQVMAKYYQQIYAIDFAVGMIRDALKEAGESENTVIIYTSDNGFLCGSHGYGSKVLPYEEASRVPLIIFDPREAGGLRSKALTGNVDMGPTILDFAGVAIPAGVDGKSLVPVLKQPEANVHDALPLMNVWGPKAVHSLAVVTNSAKLIYWPYSEEECTATIEMYDLGSDRLELEDVSKSEDHATLLAEMQTHYRQLLEHWSATGVPYHGYPGFAEKFTADFLK